MNKTIFHGSSRKFDAFIIDPALTITNELSLMEGVGIYLTEKYDLANGIGAYTYIVEVDDKNITDMTDARVIRNVVRKTLQKVDSSLIRFIKLDNLVEGVKSGQISVTKLFRELELLLDSNENFYARYGDKITFDDDCLYKKIEEAYLETVGDVLKYYDSGYGHDNYICFRNPECLHIVKVEE